MTDPFLIDRATQVACRDWVTDKLDYEPFVYRTEDDVNRTKLGEDMAEEFQLCLDDDSATIPQEVWDMLDLIVDEYFGEDADDEEE